MNAQKAYRVIFYGLSRLKISALLNACSDAIRDLNFLACTCRVNDIEDCSLRCVLKQLFVFHVATQNMHAIILICSIKI